jgi:hypothetical protein
MEKETLRFEYETPALAAFSPAALRGVVVGDSACTDPLQELDGFDF